MTDDDLAQATAAEWWKRAMLALLDKAYFDVLLSMRLRYPLARQDIHVEPARAKGGPGGA